MKFLPALLLAFCFAASSAALADPPARVESLLRNYPLTKIAAHTYVILGLLGEPSPQNQGFMNNPGFVITKDSVVVIDPGSNVQTGRMLLKQIRSMTNLPVSHVFDTHVHGDHWMGNQAFRDAFPKAQFIGHAEMIKKLKAGEAENWLSLMNNLTQGYSKETQAVIPAVAATDGEVFKIGGMSFRIHAPENAHSHSDIMIEAVEESVVFTGDNVLNQRIGRMDDATFKGNIAACDVIAKVNAKHYVPGHGPAGDVGIVKNFRQYLATLYDETKKLHEAGKADYEMKPQIVAKLKPYQSWNGFDQQVGKQISLAMLEIESDF